MSTYYDGNSDREWPGSEDDGPVILDTIFQHEDGLHTVSRDPSDGEFCVWRGDAYVASSRFAVEAMELCRQAAAAFAGREVRLGASVEIGPPRVPRGFVSIGNGLYASVGRRA